MRQRVNREILLKKNVSVILHTSLTKDGLGHTLNRLLYTCMLTKEQKQKLIEQFRTHPTDTGSPEIQIAILTEEIKLLTEHLQKHKKDHSSRRGLLRKVAERRRLIKYLEREDKKRWETITNSLKLNKTLYVSSAEKTGAVPEEEPVI